ncbi:MAG: type II toxin-antitoxin system VapC family toxin [Bifidobacteriaceae bacterium]|jgi:predicted nucleic acid-binding protein|nr:type II toxin-antitoxin system VapC family toxin [Bifidobacteriaceae bacterium]
MTLRLFLDTSVLLYALGAVHPARGPCRAIVRAASDGLAELHVSIEAVQEVLFHRMRRTNRSSAVSVAIDVMSLAHCHPLNAAVMTRACELTVVSPIRGRNAIHAATALIHGFASIVTLDTDFAHVPGLAAVTPIDCAGQFDPGT